LFEGGHGDLAGVYFPFDLDGTEEAVESEFDEAVFAALDPFGARERGEHGGGEAFAIGLVAGDAVSFAAVNFGSFIEGDEVCSFEWTGGFAVFFVGFGGEFLPFEVGFGGGEDRLDPIVGGVFGDLGEDGESFFRSEPGSGDGGLKADPGGCVKGGFLEKLRLVGDLMAAVAEDVDGGGADAVVFGGEELF